MVVVFVLVLVSLIGLVHWYLWRRLVRDVSAPGGIYRRVGTVLAFVLPAVMILAQVSLSVGLPFTLQQVIAWPGYMWAALLIYLLLALLAGELLRPLLHRIPSRRAAREAGGAAQASREPVPATASASSPELAPATAGAAGASAEVSAGASAESAPESAPAAPESAPAGPETVGGPGRRLVVARGVAIGAAAVATATVGYGAYAARRLTTKQVTVPLAKLPRSVDGYRIAVVADIHLGPILGRAHCQRVVDAVNRTQPDLIAVVGDLVDGDVDDLRSAAEPLAQLASRDGAYFVTGNHEYYVGAGQWIDHVRELGLVPLENARDELPGFDLAGVNDVAGDDYGQGPDFGAALGDRDPQRASVLLAHQPVQIHDAVRHGVDLQLSGHTHGGQLWPGPYLAELANPTVAGLERYGDTQLYVSRGAGSWGPPVRVGADPDITVVTLASRAA